MDQIKIQGKFDGLPIGKDLFGTLKFKLNPLDAESVLHFVRGLTLPGDEPTEFNVIIQSRQLGLPLKLKKKGEKEDG